MRKKMYVVGTILLYALLLYLLYCWIPLLTGITDYAKTGIGQEQINKTGLSFAYATFLTLGWTLILCIAYIIHICKNTSLTRGKKFMWIIAIWILNLFSMPVYLKKYILPTK